MRRAYPATSAHKIAASRRLTCASATNVSSTKRIQDLAKPIAPAGRTRHGNCGAGDERDELGAPLVLPLVPGPHPTTSCRNGRVVHRRKIGNRWQGRVNFGHCSDVRCTTALPTKAEVHPRSCYVAISGYQHSSFDHFIMTFDASGQLARASNAFSSSRASPKASSSNSHGAKALQQSGPDSDRDRPGRESNFVFNIVGSP